MIWDYSKSHSSKSASRPPDMSRFSSDKNTRRVTALFDPIRVALGKDLSSKILSISHNLIVLSIEHVATKSDWN